MKAATKSRSLLRSTVSLPQNIHLTEDEISSVAQWIRLRRNKRIWTRALIQALLDWDSEQTDDPSIEHVQEMLGELRRINVTLDGVREGLVSDPKPPRSQHRAFVRYFVDAAGAILRGATPDFVLPDSVEEEFYQLLRLWRLEHAAPTKREFPRGRLGQSDDE